MNTQSTKKNDSVKMRLVSTGKPNQSNVASFAIAREAKRLENAKQKVYEAAKKLDW